MAYSPPAKTAVLFDDTTPDYVVPSSTSVDFLSGGTFLTQSGTALQVQDGTDFLLQGDALPSGTGQTVSPGVGSASFTGFIPEVLVPTPQLIEPAVGTITISGLPVGVPIIVGVGSVNATGLAPSVLTPRVVIPTGGAATFAGYPPVPLIFTGGGASPEAGELTFTGLAPSLVLPRTVIPSTGGASFTGLAPLAFEQVLVQTQLGSATFAGYAPTTPTKVQVSVGSMTFSGHAPEAFQNVITPVPTGSALFSGNIPSYSEGIYTQIALGSVAVTGLAPTIIAPNSAVTGVGALTFTGHTPAVFERVTTVTPIAGGPTPIMVLLSGGLYNSDPHASLGGPASVEYSGFVLSQTATVAGVDALPNLKVLGGHGLSVGEGFLQWDPAGFVTFTDANNKVGRADIGPTGLYWTGNAPGQILLWVTGSMPPTSESVAYLVYPWQQNLFDDLVYSERSANHANYRCLYIQNRSGSALEEVSVRVKAGVKFGSLAVATEYPSDVGINAANAHYVEANAIQRGGVYLMGARPESAVAEYKDFTHINGPFYRAAYEPILSDQASDGRTVQVASVLADETDSTNVLSGLSWGDTVTWSNLANNGFVSFWLRREINAGTSGTALEPDNFTMDVRYKRSYS